MRRKKGQRGTLKGTKLGKRGPVIIPTDAHAKEFIKKRAVQLKNARNTYGMTNIQRRDRNYLMSIFQVLRRNIKGTVPLKTPKHVTNKPRYTPIQMYRNVMKYMEVTIEAGQPLTITAMALFMGINKSAFFTTLNHRGFPLPDYQFMYDCADFIESYNEYSAHRKMNPAGPIFILKNFGWKDKFEVEASSTKGALTEEERENAQKRIAGFSEKTK